MQSVTGTGRVVAGRYQLLGQIGQGAMGTVWGARDLVLARDVAVKEVGILALATAGERKILQERALREARVAARLNHPGLVTVHDVIESDGGIWIVMELVPSRSLARVLVEDGPLPPVRAAELGAMLLDALGSAHAAGIVHRDVKPANVLLTTDGRAVLTDFGIATLNGDPGLTQAGMVMGTPGFCAPERIRGEPASPASDLWSLGATLYAALEGHGPFESRDCPMAVLTHIVHADPPRAASGGPLSPVISALMCRDPAQRPDFSSAARLLADAMAASGVTADPAEGAAAAAEPAAAAAERATAGPAAAGPAAGAVEPAVVLASGAAVAAGQAGRSAVPAEPAPLPAGPTLLPAGQTAVPAQPAPLPAESALLPAGPTLLPAGPIAVPAQPAPLPAGPAERGLVCVEPAIFPVDRGIAQIESALPADATPIFEAVAVSFQAAETASQALPEGNGSTVPAATTPARRSTGTQAMPMPGNTRDMEASSAHPSPRVGRGRHRRRLIRGGDVLVLFVGALAVGATAVLAVLRQSVWPAIGGAPSRETGRGHRALR